MPELTPIIKDSFLQFSGAVLQSRALPDAADLLKPSARQIFYCLYTDKFTHNKPFQKTLKAIGSAFRVYIHGDSSAEGIIMRAGQPFAMRYPLMDVEGSYGTLIASGSWSAPRYTSARLSELASYLFADLDKETIEEWRDNYDDTEQYPMHLPSKGFFNVVNGSQGIGVGAACSIPQYNLREVNQALIKLLWNPEVDYDEIFCAPDFATGATLLNLNDVKESMRVGNGAACKLRSTIEYDAKERCLIVSEIPYMVYTETLCRQLEEIINNEEENPGIERFNDLTGKEPNIKIYLAKKANPDKVIKYLYKNTSFQTHYGINFTILDQGRYPKVFGWRELLQAHLDHELVVYRRGFEFDLRKIRARIHIIEGLLKAYDAIDEVVMTIKTSSSAAAANTALQKLLEIDSDQAKAILDLKLSRLSKLDITKLGNERDDLIKEATRIEAILGDEILLKKEIEKGLREVAEKFGDARRTKIVDLQTDSNDEIIEVSQLQIHIDNQNNIIAQEASSLFTQKRGGVGAKSKFTSAGSCLVNSNEAVLLFTNRGNVYHIDAADLETNQLVSITNFVPLLSNERVCVITPAREQETDTNIIFFTKKGLLKKSVISEYNANRKKGVKALSLDDGDEIVSAIITNFERVGILTSAGNFAIINTKDVRTIGRTGRGVKAITLADNDYVVSARIVPNDAAAILSISSDGYSKRTAISEFAAQMRGGKGIKIQKFTDSDSMADFYPITNETELIITSSRASIKVSIDTIPLQMRNTVGVSVIKLKDAEKIIKIYTA